MLNKLIQKRNLILIVYASVLLIFWMVALFFGDEEDKIKIHILSLIIPFIVYGFVRLMYKVVSINAPLKILCLFYYFFLVGGFLGTAMMCVQFIGEFPNGLSPFLGACGALIISTLDNAKKMIEFENKK